MKKLLSILLAGVLSLSVFSSVDGGTHNCKPAWKCQSPTPTPTVPPTQPPTAGYTLINYASSEFNTPATEGNFEAVYTNFYAYPWGYDDTSNNGHYDPSIISVHDGMLDAFIRTTNSIHRVAAFGPCLSATGDNPVHANCQQNQLYGRYEVRFKVDSMHGYKGAWLLWPKSEVWPRDGEIDFPEGDFDSTIAAFMHRQGGTSGSDQDVFPTGVTWTNWHTTVTEWAPTYVKFYMDGTLIGTSTSRIPNTPMRWVIQNETTLDGFEPADSVQGHVLIDYVKVWRYTP